MDKETKRNDSNGWDLRETIQEAGLGLDAIPDPRISARQMEKHETPLCKAFHTPISGSSDDIKEIIQLIRQSKDMTPAGLRQPTHLTYVAAELYHTFVLTGAIENLNESIAVNTSALEVTHDNHDRAVILTGVGTSLLCRYRRARKMRELEKSPLSIYHETSSISISAEATGSTQPDVTGNQDVGASDLEDSIAFLERGIAISPLGCPNHAILLETLSKALMNLYLETNSADHFEASIATLRQAIEGSHEASKPTLLRELASWVGSRMVKTVASIEESIQLAKEALGLATGNLQPFIRVLGSALLDHYRASNKIEDLDEVIRVSKQALNTPSHTVEDLIALDNVGYLLFERYELLGDIIDITESTWYARRILHALGFDLRAPRDDQTQYLRQYLIDQWKSDTGARTDIALDARITKQLGYVTIGNLNLIKYVEIFRSRIYAEVHEYGQWFYLRQSTDMLRAVLKVVPDDTTLRLALCHDLYELYIRSKDPIHIEEAMEFSKHIVDSADDEADRALYIPELALHAGAWYDIRGNVASLDEAIELSSLALKYPKRHDEEWQERCCEHLIRLYCHKYFVTQAEIHLENAINYARQLVDIVKERNPRGLFNLASALVHRYYITNDMADLTECICLGRRSLAIMSEPVSGHGGALLYYGLGIGLYQLYVETLDRNTLTEAVKLLRQTIDLADEPSHWQFTLASLLCERYIKTGILTDLEDAIKIGGPLQHAQYNERHPSPDLVAKFMCYFGLFYFAFNISDYGLAEKVVYCNQNALDNRAPTYSNKARYLSNLSLDLLKDPSLTEVEKAVHMGGQAVDMTSHDNLELPWYLSCLAVGLIWRYSLTGQSSDLHEAIEASRKAVENVTLDQAGRSFYLTVLSMGLHARYNTTGRLFDLREGIDLGIQAFNLSQGDKIECHWNRSWCAGNLAIHFQDKYLRGGAIADMDMAMRFHHQGEKSDEFLWRNKSDLVARLGDANAGYYSLHLSSSNDSSSEQRNEFPIHVSFPKVSDYPSRLAQVGNKYLGFYQRYPRPFYLDHAIRLFEASVAATPRGHLARPDRLYGLGQSYEEYYDRNLRVHHSDYERKQVLDTIIEAYQEIIDTGSTDTEVWISTVHCVGLIYCSRFVLLKDRADLKLGLHFLQESVNR